MRIRAETLFAFITIIVFISGILMLSGDSISDINMLNDNMNFSGDNDSILNNPEILLIISIDRSSSQDSEDNYRFNATKESIEQFISALSNQDNARNINVGLAVWDSALNYSFSLAPTANLAEVKEKIKSIKASGNTCLGVGLQGAMNMIGDTDNKKYIIYISNGIEQYCSDSIEVCSIARDLKNAGVTIYTIGEKDPMGNLTCIASPNKFFDLNQMSLDRALQNISEDILPTSGILRPDLRNPLVNKQDKTIDLNITMSKPFNLKANATNITIRQLATNLTVSKWIEGGPIGPRVIIRITTPPPRYVDKDILFSLDSSGSIGLENYLDEMRTAMKKVARYLNNREKGERINISILSWDSDVDFTYGDINNGNKVNSTRFVPIGQAEKELDWIMKNFTSDETEPTLFDVGLNEAFRILEEDPNKYNPNNRRILLFVAGRSEFMPWTRHENYNERIPVCTIGIGLPEDSIMRKTLQNIATSGNKSYRDATPGAIQNSFEDFMKEILGENGKDLGDKMIELLDETMNEPLLYNLTILDSMNPYLELDPESISIRKDKEYIDFFKNTNETNLALTIPVQLKPGSNIEISYDAKMNLTLPLSGAIGNEAINQKFLGSPEPRLKIEYNWQDGKKYEIDVPSNYIHIFS